jgi:type I restriction enzyme M protein
MDNTSRDFDNVKTVKKDKKKSSKSTNKESLPKKNKSTKLSKNKGKNVEENIDYSYLRLPDNEILIELNDEDNKLKNKSKKSILRMIKNGHNYLYNAENLEGQEALNDIMNFLFIKCIKPILSNKKEENKIDLLNKEYYKSLYSDKQLDEILSYFTDLKLLANQELSAIRNMKEPTDIIRQMGEILITHPITREIFTENNFIRAKKAPTIQGLLNEVIIPLDIKDIEQNEDVIGEIYEFIINGYVKKGSKLGQFFTPRKLMKLIFKYKENRINEIIKKLDKKEKIKFYDSCMGTGGWLVTGYNILKEKYKNRILLSGGEIKTTTFQYGLMNLILTLKKFPQEVKCESSLSHINNTKHHIILTNPPFQTDKKFNDIKINFMDDTYTKENKINLDDVYKLKDNSPPIQFLELDKYKLEENGLCLIILPYGELFFGSSNKSFREYFMNETNITDIILFEGGTFTHTGIKTCALIFENDKKGTKSINFIKANKDCNILTKITTVLIDDIKKEPNYSWYLRDYLKDEYIEKLSSELTNFEWDEFGKVFTLEKGKLQSSKVEEVEDGDGVMVTQSKNSNDYKKIKEYKLTGENLFVGNIDSGKKFCIIFYKGNCDYTNLLSHSKINKNYKEKINIKYIYYFLKSLQDHLTINYLKGSCNLSLDIKNFNRMKIPIPNLNEQNKIIGNIIVLENDKKNLIQGINSNANMRKMYMEAMIKNANSRGINKVMKLGEVCVINNGKNITEAQFIDGNYPVIGGGKNYIGYHNEYNAPENTITISKDGNTCGSVLIHKTNIFVSNHGLFINSINNKIITKNYLYNYLLIIQHILLSYGKGSAQPGINKDDIINKVKIPVPLLDYQKYMEKAFDNFDKLDDELNKMMQKNEDYIQTAFLNSLDDYGNPNGFNLEKILLNDTEDNKKTKSKKINV